MEWWQNTAAGMENVPEINEKQQVSEASRSLLPPK